ncbi:dipeptidase [Pseudoteredinibacter isoporae]|uniref:Membrane dipeptidase n=1 Tax=Pseudoteredinibacter isoporae TaxID=570281 RepID=A0A7X0JU26_9GAMM|nr:dipeptidase [Pseudoteredinibacter isoporae]MBB6521411.1 membrane dipeptidase [Pseudoteredinibacter isoporae]NHO86966.1 membrane dipeptidase [Pseudoteredinibacter isoporae]NIB24581.1 membrane dipeptidase [Pseudoteredinibacter isoporae]
MANLPGINKLNNKTAFLWLATASLSFASSAYAAANIEVSPKATQLARDALIVDTHIDVPYRIEDSYADVTKATKDGDFDYPRASRGGLDAAFMSVYIPAEYEKKGGSIALADRLIDRVEAMVGRAPEKFALAYSTQDMLDNQKAGKISLPMGMENGTPIEGNMENLKYFYDRGIRYITLAHSKSNHISDSSYSEDKPHQGLSDFGKKLITEMNNIGMMIDISHVSDQAFYDVMAVTKAPVIASHSSLRHFTPGWERNMDDKMLQALKKNGGVIQINFGSAFIHEEANGYNNKRKAAVAAYKKAHPKASEQDVKGFEVKYKKENPYPYASLDQVLDHFDYAVKLIGIDHVGVGSDYDGVGDSLPENLKDVASYPALVQGLLNRGYSETDIRKILGDNLLRVWQAVESYGEKH